MLQHGSTFAAASQGIWRSTRLHLPRIEAASCLAACASVLGCKAQAMQGLHYRKAEAPLRWLQGISRSDATACS